MGVNAHMRFSVVQFDVVKVGSVFESRIIPVQIADPLVDVGVVRANHANVTFKVLHVHGVEADNGCKQPYVGLSQIVPSQVFLAGLVTQQ